MEPTPTQLRYIKRNARRAARDVLAAYAEHSRIPVNPILEIETNSLIAQYSDRPVQTQWNNDLGHATYHYRTGAIN